MSLAERLVVALLALALVGCGGRLAAQPSAAAVASALDAGDGRPVAVCGPKPDAVED